MQKIENFCDCCGKEMVDYRKVVIHDKMQCITNKIPKWNGIYLIADGVNTMNNIDYDLCQDCAQKVIDVVLSMKDTKCTP